ncbi:MAG: hypothetical protein OER86_01845 [Phycisphaerae bacterium]|nr:hypothetical protein [Phycisphaerae bacterium]
MRKSKQSRLGVALLVTALAGCSGGGKDGTGRADVNGGPAAEDPPSTLLLRGKRPQVQHLMRGKLVQSQRVLEGITLEDFDQVRRAAQELIHLTNMGEWQVVQDPDYVRYSDRFRASLQSLVADGESQDVDGATLHYFQMTMNCVQCHMRVRALRLPR